ncbi:MAG: hypothetical protein IT305_05875, partial [Chloroflexi bacterium]|nr:hypothetical protein [Chloroflexota bacterium]
MSRPRLLRRARGLAARALGRTRGKAPVSGDLRYPDWSTILDTNRPLWEDARRRAAAGPNVLVATSTGGYAAGSIFESVLSAALTLRGARVHTLLCDRFLPGCQRAEIVDVPDPRVLVDYELPYNLCDACYATGRYCYDPLGLTGHRLSRLVTRIERQQARTLAASIPFDEIPHWSYDGLPVGEHAYAGALRYYARGDLGAAPYGET